MANFIFKISERDEAADFSKSISDQELSRFGEVGHCISKIKRILPKQIESTCRQFGTSIRLDITSDDTQQDAFEGAVGQVRDVVDGLNKLILSLKSNANSESPLPDKRLSIRSGDIEAIKSFLKAEEKSGLQVKVEINGEPVHIHKVEASDFTSGDDFPSKKKRLRGMVVGLRRDDIRGHVILVSDEEIRIRTPIETWPLIKLANAVSQNSHFEGTITKSLESGWYATEDACLHSQLDAFPADLEK